MVHHREAYCGMHSGYLYNQRYVFSPILVLVGVMVADG